MTTSLDNLVCPKCSSIETSCSSKDIGPDERFIFKFELRCRNCGYVYESQNIDGGDPNSDSDAGNSAFCPYCGTSGERHS